MEIQLNQHRGWKNRRFRKKQTFRPKLLFPTSQNVFRKKTEKKLSTIITLKHETWYDAMEVRVPVSKTVKVCAKGAEVFNSLWTLATEKLDDNAAHILLFDRDIEKNPRVVRPTSVWNRTLQSWAWRYNAFDLVVIRLISRLFALRALAVRILWHF